jgi:DNA mismatch repair protein MutS
MRQRALIDDLPLFSAAARTPPPPAPAASAVEDRLRALAPDDLSPREALDLIYELRRLIAPKP